MRVHLSSPRPVRTSSIALLVLALAPFAACEPARPAGGDDGRGSDSAGDDADDSGDGGAARASTACAVFVAHCVRCHDGILVSPDLRPGTQASLVGAPSGYAPNTLVVASDPDASFLYRKMADTQGPVGGTAMPPTYRVSAAELEVVRAWIAGGAADDCDGTEIAP
jgi:hypothetical protein